MESLQTEEARLWVCTPCQPQQLKRVWHCEPSMEGGGDTELKGAVIGEVPTVAG